MTHNTTSAALTQDEYPPAGNLLHMLEAKPLPTLELGIVGSLSVDETTNQAKAVLIAFNTALAKESPRQLADCFYHDQSYWRDQLALTWHLRTFETASTIAASFLETKRLRGVTDGLALEGEALLIPVTPVLQFIDFGISFKTTSPSCTCSGKIRLLPIKNRLESGEETVSWKIWVLSTWLQDLDVQPEDESLLQLGRQELGNVSRFESDVFIIGGGNSAVALAARLKALGVDSVIAERNANIGDNWALRYDSLRFHVPTSFCELPYMRYEDHLRTPHYVSKDELAAQVKKFATTFNLNTITSARITSTSYDQGRQLWYIALETPAGAYSVTSKHLVQATGFGSQNPYVPNIAGGDLYKGTVVHPAQYKNAAQIASHAKSVIVIGSANTAFDVIEDCHAAGLQTTMVARSPTFVMPLEYVCDRRSLGVYDIVGVEAGDRLQMTGPVNVDAALVRDLFAFMASEEPHRYDSLAKAGFPVYDSRESKAGLISNLLERAGGHYVDMGSTKLIADGKVAVKGRVEPVAFTETGLKFSDGTTLDADAVIWCTGFKDKNARAVAAGILGGKKTAVNGSTHLEHLLGPEEIAARLDATWGLDAEAEVRGMWKRHLNIDNYWTMGGHTQHHRWHSRTLALQIKAALAGILPPAYRETPLSQEE
ncbi:hypothetical protein TruAng_001927 [Truncatella angustata]|nr:hypothetical protein TruAng_001927 [Truncatella angustata]